MHQSVASTIDSLGIYWICQLIVLQHLFLKCLSCDLLQLSLDLIHITLAIKTPIRFAIDVFMGNVLKSISICWSYEWCAWHLHSMCGWKTKYEHCHPGRFFNFWYEKHSQLWPLENELLDVAGTSIRSYLNNFAKLFRLLFAQISKFNFFDRTKQNISIWSDLLSDHSTHFEYLFQVASK